MNGRLPKDHCQCVAATRQYHDVQGSSDPWPSLETHAEKSNGAILLAPVAINSAKLPPYGREVVAAIAENRSPSVLVCAGPFAWERARARRNALGDGCVLLLPPGDDPEAYYWPVVPGGLLIDGREVSRLFAIELGRVIVSGGTQLAFVIRQKEGFPIKASTWRNPLGVIA